MINKQFILGTVLGIFIGVSSSSFAYYSTQSVTELTAYDLENIVKSAVSSELSSISLELSSISLKLSSISSELMFVSHLTNSDLMVYCSN